MVALPPAPGITKAVLNATLNGVAVANVLNFTAPPGPDAPDPEDLANRLIGWWDNVIQPLVSTAMILQNVTCTDLSADGPPSFVGSTGLPLAGSIVGEAMPGNVALVMSLRTALRGRSFRGRIYHCGFAETQVGGNNVLVTPRDALVTAYSQLIVFVEPLLPDYLLSVLSYYSNGALRPEGIATPVTTLNANTRVDTQRGRLQ